MTMSLLQQPSLLQAQISLRRSPSFWMQLWLLLRRGTIKYLRAFWPLRVIDTLLLLASSFIIGFIHSSSWELGSVPSNAVMTMTCLGVLSTVTHLRTFSSDRLLLVREAASGVSVTAFFVSQNLIDLAWIFTAPAIFLGPYYYLTLLRLPFWALYLAGVLVSWWASGMAYLVSAVVPQQAVLMTGVFIALILGAFLQGVSPTLASVRGTFVEYILAVSYNRWAMEAVTISEAEHYQDNMRNVILMIFKGVGLCGIDHVLVTEDGESLSPREAISFLQLQENFTFAYCERYRGNAYVALTVLGTVARLIAYVALKFVTLRSAY